MKGLNLLAAAALAAAVSGCSNSGERSTMAFETFNGSATYRLEGTAQVFGQDSDIYYADSVSLLLPIRLNNADITPLRDSITGYALGNTGRPIRQAISAWLKETAASLEYKAVAVDGNSAAADLVQGFDNVSGYVMTLTDEMMVYCVLTESYSPGAAHGMTTRRYFNFSTTGKGELLTLEKIFTPEGLRKLPALLAQQASNIPNLQVSDPRHLPLPDSGNFFISPEGEIVFAYQPYEIASFAEGNVNISFYPYELVDYMTPEAISFFRLNDLND